MQFDTRVGVLVDLGAAPLIRRWRVIGQIVAATTLLMAGFGPLSVASAATAPAMLTPGRFSVNDRGAFTYTVPIAVPPGTAGMVPSLSLDYDSQVGDGLEGIGWSLTGLPSIGRCPRTIAQDGVHGGVNYDLNDRFCMEGQRLVLISGTYGADGSQYRTEIEGFSEIIAHGSAGNGPAWFEVHTKAGQILDLGDTTDSRILAVGKTTARAWAVNQISDTAGDYLTVSYTNDTTNGQAYPNEIDYTGNAAAGLTPYNKVTFTYATRGDVTPTYQAGSLLQTTKILTDIKTFAGSEVADYKLVYSPGSTTAHSLLTSIQQCDGTGTTCLPATSFTWQGSGWQPTMTENVLPAAQNTANVGSVIPGDFNGDGLTDIIINSPSPGPCDIFAGTQSQSAPFVSSGIKAHFTLWTNEEGTWTDIPTTTSCLNQIQVSLAQSFLLPDQNGDGFTDLVLFQNVQATGNPNGVPTAFYLTNIPSGGTRELSSANDRGDFGVNGYVGDFNGDGLTDYLSPSVNMSIYYEFFTGGGNVGPIGNGPGFVVGDFDGDGCADVLSIQKPWSPTYPQNYNVVIFSCLPAAATLTTGIAQNWGIVTGDFNGDGKTDILAINPAGGGTLYLSTGTGLVAQTFSVGSDWQKYTIVVGDFNGDGKQDIALVADGLPGHYGSGTPHQIWLSNGTGFVHVTAYNISNSDSRVTPVVADWNNDGASDLWLQRASGDAQYLFGFVPPAIATVSNGLGVTTTITYDRLNHATVYTKGTTAAYPSQDLNGPFYVVSRIDSSNGVGGTYSSAYAYVGAQSDLQGRGFLGFTRTSVTDLQTHIVQTTRYRQDFPYTGLVASQTRNLSGVTFRTIANTYASTSPNPSTYFVHLTQTVTSGADLDGSVLPTVTTTYGTYDAYGNPLSIAVSTPDGATKTTTSTYSNDTTHWFLGRLLTAQVQSVVGASNITRSTSYAYAPTTGLLTSEIVEPNTPSLKLETDYGYDAYGNRNSATVSGSGITTRTTSQTFDSHGEFVMTAKNALLQSESWTHSAAFGLPTAHTDIDSLSSSWNYDTFGRPILMVATDGTRVSYAYLYCLGVNGGTAACPANGAFLVQATPLGTDGATQIGPVAISYFDGLSRQIATSVQGFDGSIIRVDTPYDSQGHILQSSRPYFCPGQAGFCGGSPQWTVFTYDALGRVTLATMPDASKLTTAFHGLSVSVTNDKSQTTTTVKNDEGLVATVTDAMSGPTSYVYDAFGDALTTTGPLGKTITNTFDTRGRKITSSDPDMGGWMYGYDVLDELTSQTDAKSQQTSLFYDVLGRLTQRVEPGLTSTWQYDTASHGIGRLASATTSAGYSRVYTYDTLGRPTTVSLTINSSIFNYTTSYGAIDGKVYETTYPSSLIVDHAYNAWGYAFQLKDHVTGSVYWLANTRDAELHLLSQTLGSVFTTTQTFIAATGRIQTIQAGAAGAIANFSYGFDTLGNLTSRADVNEALSETFFYDSLNRLTGVINNIGPWSATYDAEGDILTKSDVGTYSYSGLGAGPHAVTSVAGTVNGVFNPSFTYDANGNLTGGAGRTLTYTSFNMTSAVTDGSKSLSLAYDSEHQRISQVAPEGTTLYLNDPASGSMSEQFTAGTTVTWRDYIRADGALVALRLTQGSTITAQYIVTDHLGSAAVVTDSLGNVLQRLSYDAWGARRNPNGTVPVTPIVGVITRGFTDQEMMDDVALVNFNARLYDPQLGRFLAADPVLPNDYIDQLLDRYGYVTDNPLSLTDPSGLCFLGCFWHDAIFRDILAITAVLTLQYEVLPALEGAALTNVALTGPLSVLNSGITGGIAGLITTGNYKGALLGSAEAIAFVVIGDSLQFPKQTGIVARTAAEAVGHGLVGGLFTDAEGGKFGAGFLAAGVGSLPVDSLTPNAGFVLATGEQAVLGGFGSLLGGGKFANGAITGAFGYMYNDLAHMIIGQDSHAVLLRYLQSEPGGENWVGNTGFFGLFNGRVDLLFRLTMAAFEIKPDGSSYLGSIQLENYISSQRDSDNPAQAGNFDLVFRGKPYLVLNSIWAFGRTTYTYEPSPFEGVITYQIDNRDVLSAVRDAFAARPVGGPSPLPLPPPFVPVFP